MTGTERATTPARPLVWVVSGLPRSGTSMGMQLLEAAGLPLLADGRRQADADNVRGYFEFEGVKGLARDASFLDAAIGRGVKVVAPLLRWLPSRFDYAVLFMERPIEAVLDSQQAMLERLGAESEESDRPIEASGDPAALAQAFEASLRDARSLICDAPHFRAHFLLGYDETIASPRAAATSLLDFMAEVDRDGSVRAGWGRGSPGRVDCVERMASVVDPLLCRQGRDRGVGE